MSSRERGIYLLIIGVLLVTALLHVFGRKNPLFEVASAQPRRVEQFQSGVDSPVDVRIHFFDGLPDPASQLSNELRFFGSRPQISLLLTNQSDQELVLWRPWCPQGDGAFSIQFREDEAATIREASTTHIYTGGMGFAKTVTLAPHDSLIRPIDFTSFWSVPFKLDPNDSTEMMMRVVYESQRFAGIDKSRAPNADEVWVGRVETPWQKVRIVNLMEEPIQ